MKGKNDNNRTWKLDETSEGWRGFKERSQNIQKEVEEMSMARVINMLLPEATGNNTQN